MGYVVLYWRFCLGFLDNRNERKKREIKVPAKGGIKSLCTRNKDINCLKVARWQYLGKRSIPEEEEAHGDVKQKRIAVAGG